jgi:catechol O-methyltransferase
MNWWHKPLMEAIAAESIRKLSEFDLMECGNSVWALARLPMRDDVLCSLLFERIFESPTKVDSQAVHALCCATWALSRGDLTWKLFEDRAKEWQAMDATSYGFLLMHASWEGQQHRNVQVLTSLACVASAELLRSVAARWVSCDRWFDKAFHPQRLPMQSENDIGAWYRYQKLGLLLDFVETHALQGDPQSVLKSIEGFVKDAHHRWLKIAGGPKAEVVDEATRMRPLTPREMCVEMGCFVGYTAIRLGWRLGTSTEYFSSRRPAVVSTELESVHVCIGRHHIDAARLSGAAEVMPGHIPWTTPRYVELFGHDGVGFTFMDHKGTRFHKDFGECQALRILSPWSRLLCDNVLKPGAPDHLWMHHRSPHTSNSAAVWALHEFHEPETEDWQSLCDNPPN